MGCGSCPPKSIGKRARRELCRRSTPPTWRQAPIVEDGSLLRSVRVQKGPRSRSRFSSPIQPRSFPYRSVMERIRQLDKSLSKQKKEKPGNKESNSPLKNVQETAEG